MLVNKLLLAEEFSSLVAAAIATDAEAAAFGGGVDRFQILEGLQGAGLCLLAGQLTCRPIVVVLLPDLLRASSQSLLSFASYLAFSELGYACSLVVVVAGSPHDLCLRKSCVLSFIYLKPSTSTSTRQSILSILSGALLFNV